MEKSETIAVRTPDLTALIDAVWQVLDDMDGEHTACCLFAKAQLRVAYEPFREDGLDMDMPLEEARRIVKECEDAR